MELLRQSAAIAVREPDQQQICATDFFINPVLARPYESWLRERLMAYVSQALEPMGLEVSLLNYWFQSYLQGDYHEWHDHRGDCNYSMVYYLDLPQGACSLEFRQSHTLDTEQTRAHSGDIVIFPSTWQHRSRINTATRAKTVIAANLALEIKD